MRFLTNDFLCAIVKVVIEAEDEHSSDDDGFYIC